MRPLIIPVFLPFSGCRQQCLFCNQRTNFQKTPTPASVRDFIEASLARIPSGQAGKTRQVAFYGGSFTAMEKADQGRYLKAVQPFLASGAIHSIRVSTRPDALEEDILALLRAAGVKTIEVGAQSMIDEVLRLSKRGHCAADTVSAVSRLRRAGFETGIHLMIGLPGDTLDHFLETLDRLIELKPDFVRIHPTLVLKGAPIEDLWRTGRYSPLALEEAVRWLKSGLLKLEAASIPVARIGLQATQELESDFLAGPNHPALHQLVDSAVFFDMAKHLLQISPNGSRAIFLCNPKDVSGLRGQKNDNLSRLKEQFRLSEILIEEREELPRGSLAKKGDGSIYRFFSSASLSV